MGEAVVVVVGDNAGVIDGGCAGIISGDVAVVVGVIDDARGVDVAGMGGSSSVWVLVDTVVGSCQKLQAVFCLFLGFYCVYYLVEHVFLQASIPPCDPSSSLPRFLPHVLSSSHCLVCCIGQAHVLL